jgi:hypothetical protein
VNSVAQFGKKSLQWNLIFKRCLFHSVKIPDCATGACHAVLHENPHRLRPLPHDLAYSVLRLWDSVAHRSLILIFVADTSKAPIDSMAFREARAGTLATGPKLLLSGAPALAAPSA